MIGAVLVVRPLCTCPAHGYGAQTQEGGVDTMDASAAVPSAALDRWLPEEALATPPPVCLLILSASDRAWLIRLWKEPQAAGQQVVQAIIWVRQSLLLSPGMIRMRAGEHMQQTWCQGLGLKRLTQKSRRLNASVNRDGPLYKHSLIHIVCAIDASSGWTAASEEQGEATPCQR
jgi:hypothetical protein